MNRRTGFYERLRSIITENILNVPKEDIDKMYDSWEDNKNKKGVKTNFVYSDKLIHKNQKTPKDVTIKGIDLPTWFGNYNNKRVVVLGIDPLRSEKIFKKENNADINNDVVIGTPYALNEKDTREGWCANYWAFINGLVEKNHFVYCTDIFKTYYYNKLTKTRSYNDIEFINNNKHREILISELELIKPDIIIAFGSIAHQKLLKKNCPTIGQSIFKTKSFIELNSKKVDVFTVMHLSKGTRGKNMKKFFEANNIDTSFINVENKVECAKKYVELFSKL
ncbi:uracil-DNA glycosylase family protein [uncultured Tenacibaculum sp.]|uniref:uracil-DNA glycosylase family protein n=1 Tax=uncultured Tenacibaculum sp. TaxID=174713 RepID=UPI00260EA8EE|nr:uracil-DNA glycosylase family protein [uncultured Tenacibaculum sp.]